MNVQVQLLQLAGFDLQKIIRKDKIQIKALEVYNLSLQTVFNVIYCKGWSYVLICKSYFMADLILRSIEADCKWELAPNQAVVLRGIMVTYKDHFQLVSEASERKMSRQSSAVVLLSNMMHHADSDKLTSQVFGALACYL